MGLTAPPNGKAASELVRFYVKEGPKIFSDPRGVSLYWKGPKYKNDELRRAATAYFGELKVSDALVDIVVTTYDIRHHRPFYVSRRLSKARADRDFLMRDVAMGTSAAPTYFAPVPLGDKIVIDGGIVANNPAGVAYAEASQIWPDEEILLVSIGTGTLTKPINQERAANWGRIAWGLPLIDCVFDGTAKATEDFFRYTQLQRYWRLQGDLSEATESLDSVTDDGITGLRQLGENISRNREPDIFRLIAELKRAGLRAAARITKPYRDQVVGPGECVVEGVAENCSAERLYLFTGGDGRYWPSAQIVPQQERWQGKVNLGTRSPTGKITLAAVDAELAEYIEFYRAKAGALGYCGIPIKNFPKSLDQVKVIVDRALQ